MSLLAWVVIVSCAVGALVVGVLVVRNRSRILFALRRRRKPGDRRAPVEKRPKPPAGKSIEAALELRERGDADDALALLEEIDQGKGLRRLLHAAALLDAGRDPATLGDASAQLGGSSADAVRVRVALGLAASGETAEADALLARVTSGFEPAVVAWAHVMLHRAAKREDAEREATVALLFADAELARTVAARDLGVEGAEPSTRAVEVYGAHTFARDAVARFGARAVARLVQKVVP